MKRALKAMLMTMSHVNRGIVTARGIPSRHLPSLRDNLAIGKMKESMEIAPNATVIELIDNIQIQSRDRERNGALSE